MRAFLELLWRNWPLKLAALALSVILWVFVAAEETTSELISVRVEVQVPPTLALSRPAPAVRALVTGPGRELIKLYQLPLTLTAVVPTGALPPQLRLTVLPADVQVPRTVQVQIQDVEPREIVLDVDRFWRRSVPVALRGVFEAEAGFVVSGAILVTPRVVEVSGPRNLVLALDSVRTEPIEVRGVTAAFERTVPLDTALAFLRVVPAQVTVNGRVRRQ